jgi:8-oxo-dGTP pyrophosphatase MutT (NUDIX family)
MIRQVATLPYRVDEAGVTRVLSITSRRTRRWVIPKGNRIHGLSLHEADAQEAFEEAGVTGMSSAKSLGQYSYEKRRKDGSVQQAKVKVFSLAVADQADSWPEQSQREAQWFSLQEAAAAVDEPRLKAIILAFAA